MATTTEKVIKNSIEITQVFDRVSGQETEHVNIAVLTASKLLEIASYRDAEDDQEVLVSNLTLGFPQTKMIRDLLNNPQELACLKSLLNRPDVSAYLD